MKKPVFILSTLALIVSITLSMTLTSCASDKHFLTSSVVPAAQGTVHVGKDGNKNYVIKIKLYNLAESNRLTPPMKAYVVWMVNGDNHEEINHCIIIGPGIGICV